MTLAVLMRPFAVGWDGQRAMGFGSGGYLSFRRRAPQNSLHGQTALRGLITTGYSLSSTLPHGQYKPPTFQPSCPGANRTARAPARDCVS